MSELHFLLVIGTVLVLVFEFTNGFHDAANMVATAIASRSMTPKCAIACITVFTFLGPLIGGVAVAGTIGEFVNIADVSAYTGQAIALSGLLAAITYNLITWKLGLPSSSSISLASGLMGAGLLGLGSNHINWGISEIVSGRFVGFMRIVCGLFVSPLVGFVVGFIVFRLLRGLFSRLSTKSKPVLIVSQYITVAWLAFSHGTNDAQKGMGVLAMLLFASNVSTSFVVPLWVIVSCASAITLGTVFGGWNIIKTVGFGIYRVKALHSLSDQIGSASVILSSAALGAPVSTTQVVITTLMGIGASERPSHVRWTRARSIGIGWLMNIPSTTVLGAAYYFLFTRIFV